MENTADQSTVVLKNEENVGFVQIADDVVAMIASLAATEVKGVSAMAGNISNELMSKVGVKKLTKGVRVALADNTVNVDLAVTLDYGYNIPATCQQVQTKVKSAIENMTGLTCETVNIRIAGVNMKKENN
ncbi:MAG: Asp23/Gls24 family envelope stress response protein [Lachnospiraceae bacterium]|nr:Asp23/Gls24 family envelope stress response protein [Lachnospiraceae bacterium]MBQ8117594.1 Asp23/Gls24 family envelope stress response protein [Lachnospiraceae bacterium]